ncbi:MAG TPA: methyltransferase domain-containing protein [Solirubrobacteraceae bacterium]|nr:methyltransferase domain-containing protein [Solirubrobacteraceae bacterium]
MGTSEMSASGRYLLGDSPAEIRHLVAQAEVYAQEATELFDLIGVDSGSSAIDVGCGVLGVVHLLAERVGADGRVIGLDREPRMVESGRGFAEQHGLAVEFIEADATATGLPDQSFDLVHARTLLLNVQNPQDVLAEMVRITKPGGVVAVQEPDASAWNCDPPHPAFDILRAAILNAYRRTGKDFNIGRRIGRMLRDTGLHDVHVRPTARVTNTGDYYQTFLLTVAGLVRDVIVQTGELTGNEFDSYTATLRAHLEAPYTITCQPVMWQAWGRTGAVTDAH